MCGKLNNKRVFQFLNSWSNTGVLCHVAVLTGAAGPGSSCSSSPQQVQLAGFTTSWHLWISVVGGYVLHTEAPRWARPELSRPPSLQHLTLHIRHLAADLGHLSLEADQDSGVWSWASHHLRPPLAFLPGVRMSWKKEETRTRRRGVNLKKRNPFEKVLTDNHSPLS